MLHHANRKATTTAAHLHHKQTTAWLKRLCLFHTSTLQPQPPWEVATKEQVHKLTVSMLDLSHWLPMNKKGPCCALLFKCMWDVPENPFDDNVQTAATKHWLAPVLSKQQQTAMIFPFISRWDDSAWASQSHFHPMPCLCTCKWTPCSQDHNFPENLFPRWMWQTQVSLTKMHQLKDCKCTETELWMHRKCNAQTNFLHSKVFNLLAWEDSNAIQNITFLAFLLQQLILGKTKKQGTTEHPLFSKNSPTPWQRWTFHFLPSQHTLKSCWLWLVHRHLFWQQLIDRGRRTQGIKMRSRQEQACSCNSVDGTLATWASNVIIRHSQMFFSTRCREKLDHGNTNHS